MGGSNSRTRSSRTQPANAAATSTSERSRARRVRSGIPSHVGRHHESSRLAVGHRHHHGGNPSTRLARQVSPQRRQQLVSARSASSLVGGITSTNGLQRRSRKFLHRNLSGAPAAGSRQQIMAAAMSQRRREQIAQRHQHRTHSGSALLSRGPTARMPSGIPSRERLMRTISHGAAGQGDDAEDDDDTKPPQSRRRLRQRRGTLTAANQGLVPSSRVINALRDAGKIPRKRRGSLVKGAKRKSDSPANKKKRRRPRRKKKKKRQSRVITMDDINPKAAHTKAAGKFAPKKRSLD